jgi:hypothetical protein
MDRNIYLVDTQDARGETVLDENLLRAVVKVNTLLTATITGCLCGLGLFAATWLSLNRGLPDPGQYMNLLGVFMPGYEVSPTGAWFGLIWGGVIGAVAGGVLYRFYARDIRSHVERFLQLDSDGDETWNPIVSIGGNALGIALGAVVACGLILTTGWLVLRGTADESVNARLLEHFLPGYSVSLPGSLIGAVQLFILVYLSCLLWSWIYNKIVSIRHR